MILLRSVMFKNLIVSVEKDWYVRTFHPGGTLLVIKHLLEIFFYFFTITHANQPRH